MTACDIMVGKKRWKKNENGNDHATMLSKQELRAKKKGPALYIDTYMKAGASV